MTLELTVIYDDPIWSPDVVSLILMETPHEGTPHVFDGTVQNEHFETLKSIRTERQPKPIDWLITERDKIIVGFAETWIALDADHSPLKFAENIWNPIRKAWLDPDIDKETDAEYYKRVTPVEISDKTKEYLPLTSGLLCCLESMKSLDAGDIESTVKNLINASWFSGAFDGLLIEQKNATTARHRDFAQRGASKRNEENRAIKADAMAHYAANAHKPEYKTKNKAAAMMAGKVVPVAYQTVRGWLVEPPTKA